MAAPKQVKSIPVGPTKCEVCAKTVYQMEQVTIDGHVMHDKCFKCAHCNKKLSPTTCSSIYNKFYCKPHFMSLFKSKGNYNQGFGEEKDQHKFNATRGTEPKIADNQSTPKGQLDDVWVAIFQSLRILVEKPIAESNIEDYEAITSVLLVSKQWNKMATAHSLLSAVTVSGHVDISQIGYEAMQNGRHAAPSPPFHDLAPVCHLLRAGIFQAFKKDMKSPPASIPRCPPVTLPKYFCATLPPGYEREVFRISSAHALPLFIVDILCVRCIYYAANEFINYAEKELLRITEHIRRLGYYMHNAPMCLKQGSEEFYYDSVIAIFEDGFEDCAWSEDFKDFVVQNLYPKK